MQNVTFYLKKWSFLKLNKTIILEALYDYLKWFDPTDEQYKQIQKEIKELE